MKEYIPCCNCSKKASWSYGPGKESYCDNCVPRGCSCNTDLKKGIDYDSKEAEDSANWVEELDDKGRRYPCCEFFEIPEESHNNKQAIELGWEAYYEMHPEERRQSEEVEHWEHKLKVDHE